MSLKKEAKINLAIFLIATISFVSSYLLNVKQPLIAGVILFVTGIIIYVIKCIESKSLFDTIGLTSAVWFITIGLSVVRLNVNQVPWIFTTWVSFYLTYVAFIIGYTVFIQRNERHTASDKSLDYNMARKMFFGVIAYVVLIIVVFIVEIIIVKEIPAFSANPAAYVNFHVPMLHYLTVSCVLVFPFTYELFKSQYVQQSEKIILGIVNVVMLLIPLLIVSRQLYIMHIIIALFTVAKDKSIKSQILWSIVAVTLLGAGWGGLSILRNQNAEYIDYVFNKTVDDNEETEEDSVDKFKKTTDKQFGKDYAHNHDAVSGAISQVYMYLSFGYDNFNYNVIVQKEYDYGKNTFFPVIALSGAKFIVPQLEDTQRTNYIQYYTTVPMTSTYYCDFGLLGVAVFMFLNGYIASYFEFRRREVAGNLMDSMIRYSMIFCFFTCFFANATMWAYFIQIAIIYLYLNKFNFRRKSV